MSNWIHALPIAWMAVLIFGATYLGTALIYGLVMSLAAGDRARAFKAVSPGLLPPLGIIFGLLVAFLAAQAWGDGDRAHAAVNREASALRAIVLLSENFPESSAGQLQGLVRRHIQDAHTDEWPAMAERRASLTTLPASLAQALKTTLTLPTDGPGQLTAQREIVTAIETAADSRRQRILVSQSHVDWIKWVSLIIQAICTLLAIAFVHCDNRSAARLAMGLFSTAVAVCILLVATHDRPFTGQNRVPPDVLLQVQP